MILELSAVVFLRIVENDFLIIHHCMWNIMNGPSLIFLDSGKPWIPFAQALRYVCCQVYPWNLFALLVLWRYKNEEI